MLAMLNYQCCRGTLPGILLFGLLPSPDESIYSSTEGAPLARGAPSVFVGQPGQKGGRPRALPATARTRGLPGACVWCKRRKISLFGVAEAGAGATGTASTAAAASALVVDTVIDALADDSGHSAEYNERNNHGCHKIAPFACGFGEGRGQSAAAMREALRVVSPLSSQGFLRTSSQSMAASTARAATVPAPKETSPVMSPPSW